MTSSSGSRRPAGGDEWRNCVATRANILVSGARDTLEAFWQSCLPHVREPIAYWCAGTPLKLDSCRTLVLVGVDRLNRNEQSAINAWVSAPANVGTQVVSLSVAPLFAAVEQGTFDADLYYRLNTIYLRLPDGREP